MVLHQKFPIVERLITRTLHTISTHMQVKLVYMMCLWNSRYCLTGKNRLFMSQLGYIVFINPEKGRNFYFVQLGRNLGGIIFYTFVS